METRVTVLRLDLVDAAAKLDSGGVLIVETDTLPGLHCRADQVAAVRRIAQIKGRSPDKPLLILASGLGQARPLLGDLSSKQLEYCHRCWPGPFSLILPAASGMPVEVTAGSGTLAVRVPALAGLQALLEAVGGPLVSTSVNREGDQPAKTLAEAEESFGPLVDGFHDCRQSGESEAAAGLPSALIDVTVWPPQVLRSGPLSPPDVVS